MSSQTPRLRMFAGPNGSGKSTIKEVINRELLSVYINPDEIEKEIKEYSFLDLKNYEVETTNQEIISFFKKSILLKKANLIDEVDNLKFSDNKLHFTKVTINSYFASVCADFIRKKLLKNKKSFTFETVMSSIDKIELLQLAQKEGYRTYLYFVATSDPIINISRVENRVKSGGHNVPKEKIISRYYRSLENLKYAISFTNRAYIFDNSTHTKTFLAEITNASEMDIKVDKVPVWFDKYILKKF